MANITVAGKAFVITSTAKLEDIKLVEKYRPEALAIYGGEDGKDMLFAIGTTNGAGHISKYGVSFGEATRDDAKLATMTKMIPDGVTGDVREWLADEYGTVITNLGAIEAKLPAVLAEISNEKARVMSSIHVLGSGATPDQNYQA